MIRILRKAISSSDALSFWAIIPAGIAIAFIMIIEVINAFGRKFAVPFPCTLEMAESLMIVCIFLAAPRVAAGEEHTFVTIMTRKLPKAFKRAIDSVTNLFGAVVIALLALGGWQIAAHSASQLEMRIGVFRFPIWPFKILFAVGLSLLALQFFMNSLRCIIDIWDKRYPED